MANRTGPATTEAEPRAGQRRFAWVSEHGWLIAGCLFVLALVPADADKAETALMRAHRERIQAMSRSERQRLEFNFEEYRKLTPKQRKEVQALHEQVQNSPELASTLTAWHQWLAGLEFEDREQLLQTTDATARLEIVRQIVSRRHARPADWDSITPGQSAPSDRSSRFPDAAQEFNALIAIIARHLDLPEHPRDDTPVGRLKHHASVLSELLISIRRRTGQEKAPRALDRFRIALPAELRRELIDALRDPARRVIAQQNEIDQQRSLAQFVFTGFYREMQVVMQHLKPDDDMLLALYLELPEEQRRVLDQLPEEQFTRRLDELWMEREFPELARHVREIRRVLPARLNQRPGLLQNGNRIVVPGNRRPTGKVNGRGP